MAPSGTVSFSLQSLKKRGLAKSADGKWALPKPHANEHALEVELPFLQTVLGSARIVPLLVGSATPTEVAEVLSRLWDDDTLIVVSSDLSHFLRYEDAQRRDSATADAIERLDETAIDFEDACGAIPVRGLLEIHASEANGNQHAHHS
jgi:MEMO1 family protein